MGFVRELWIAVGIACWGGGVKLITLTVQLSLIYCAFPSVIKLCCSLALNMKCFA
jgi:hypothetical protein